MRISDIVISPSICRSPSWGAWIEIYSGCYSVIKKKVAPPRGERGLKSQGQDVELPRVASLPLVGSVD